MIGNGATTDNPHRHLPHDGNSSFNELDQRVMLHPGVIFQPGLTCCRVRQRYKRWWSWRVLRGKNDARGEMENVLLSVSVNAARCYKSLHDLLPIFLFSFFFPFFSFCQQRAEQMHHTSEQPKYSIFNKPAPRAIPVSGNKSEVYNSGDPLKAKTVKKTFWSWATCIQVAARCSLRPDYLHTNNSQTLAHYLLTNNSRTLVVARLLAYK